MTGSISNSNKYAPRLIPTQDSGLTLNTVRSPSHIATSTLVCISPSRSEHPSILNQRDIEDITTSGTENRAPHCSKWLCAAVTGISFALAGTMTLLYFLYKDNRHPSEANSP